jgi:hypothetical protein
VRIVPNRERQVHTGSAGFDANRLSAFCLRRQVREGVGGQTVFTTFSSTCAG